MSLNGGFSAGSLQWEGLKKTGKLPHLARWYDHVGGIPILQQLAEQYYPKRNNAAKKRVADAIKEAKLKEGPAVRHTGKADPYPAENLDPPSTLPPPPPPHPTPRQLSISLLQNLSRNHKAPPPPFPIDSFLSKSTGRSHAQGLTIAEQIYPCRIA